MRVLAIETSASVGSVAALAGSELLGDLTLPPEQGSAQSLAPALKTLLDMVRWRSEDVELVAVTIGPGSFTGLRVGVTAAKTFAYAVKAQVLGLDTLETIAAGCPREVHTLATAMDAQRGQVVAEAFRRGPDGWFSARASSQLMDLDAWLATLSPGTWVAGPVLRNVPKEALAHVRVVDPHHWAPTAAALARLAAHRFASGDRDDLWALAPRYFRQSAAEEKWEQKRPET
jgi:tRNA threonylcarbamoyladenosine biosynthesis protein TsaB